MKPLLYASMLVMLFGACKKTSEHNIKNEITGTWELVQYRGDTSNQPPPIVDGMLLVLNSNNTFEFKILFDRTVLTGTYELGRKMECTSGKTADFITLHYDVAGINEAFVYLNNGELSATSTDCSQASPLTSVYHRL